MNAPPKAGDFNDEFPQAGRKRQIMTQPIGKLGRGEPDFEMEMLAKLDADTVMMMGDNPVLPKCRRGRSSPIFSSCASGR